MLAAFLALISLMSLLAATWHVSVRVHEGESIDALGVGICLVGFLFFGSGAYFMSHG